MPAATLLLKLTLAADWKQDLGDPAQLAHFKVADLACGTGTLLMAAAQAFADEYIRTRADSNRPVEQQDLSTLHRTLMENMLHGYDVLPSAVHLTASTLAMLAPEIAFVRMNLFVMPLGIDQGQARLGSLDFLDSGELKTQMALDYSQIETVRTGAAMSQETNATLPKLRLCVMNPPFVRSVGGNLLFGSLPDERGVLQKDLKKRLRPPVGKRHGRLGQRVRGPGRQASGGRRAPGLRAAGGPGFGRSMGGRRASCSPMATIWKPWCRAMTLSAPTSRRIPTCPSCCSLPASSTVGEKPGQNGLHQPVAQPALDSRGHAPGECD